MAGLAKENRVLPFSSYDLAPDYFCIPPECYNSYLEVNPRNMPGALISLERSQPAGVSPLLTTSYHCSQDL